MARVESPGDLTTISVWMADNVVGIAGLWARSGYPASASALSNLTVINGYRATRY